MTGRLGIRLVKLVFYDTDTPIKLSLTPGRAETASPLLGQHTEEIIKGFLGFSKEEIGPLRREGVI